MPRIMQPARVPAGQVPDVQALVTVANPNANLIRGALVVSTAGLIDVCGADPALIAGVALQGASTGFGFSAANSPAVVTGQSNKVSTAIANGVTEFSASLTNGSAALVAPAQTDVGVQYGVTAYAGVWTVDKAKTGASARVIVTGYDADNNVVFFRILKANRQLDA